MVLRKSNKRMEVDDIDAKLRNWAAWSRTRPQPGHCFSIEHLWRPSKSFWPEAPRTFVDVLSAIEVERAMRHVPQRQRQALIWHYIDFAYQGFICRRLCIPRDKWQEFLEDARFMLRNLLKWRICSPTIRDYQPSLRLLRQ